MTDRTTSYYDQDCSYPTANTTTATNQSTKASRNPQGQESYDYGSFNESYAEKAHSPSLASATNAINTHDIGDYGDGEQRDEPPRTLAPAKRHERRWVLASTTDCKKLQTELRACLDANSGRDSVCMWYYRLWSTCKNTQKQPPPYT